jgi:hypothetical protein
VVVARWNQRLLRGSIDMPKVDCSIQEVPIYPRCRNALANRGMDLVAKFCALNGVPRPTVEVVGQNEWHVGSCAYYRSSQIHICLEECGYSCGDANSRNWTWPGSTVDREPMGVMCHELGHHVDRLTDKQKGSYDSEYSGQVKKESGEPGLTSYADSNDWEWFAEAFRLFLTNPDLLAMVRPKTHALICNLWKPVVTLDWRQALGTNVPERVVRANLNKFSRVRRLA